MSGLKTAIIDSMVLAALAESRRFSSSVISTTLILGNILSLGIMFYTDSIRNAYMVLNLIFAAVGIMHQLVYVSTLKHAVESARKLDEILEKQETENT